MTSLQVGALLLATLALLAGPAASQCLLDFAVNRTLSSFAFGATVVEPIIAPLPLVNPGLAIGLEGRLQAVLAGECPEDVQALVEQLAGASFETSAETGPLALVPSSIQVRPELGAALRCAAPRPTWRHTRLSGHRAGGPKALPQPPPARPEGPPRGRLQFSANGFADVEWRDVRLNLTLTPLTPVLPGNSSTHQFEFESDVEAVVAEGSAAATSLISDMPQILPLAGLAASSPTQVKAPGLCPVN